MTSEKSAVSRSGQLDRTHRITPRLADTPFTGMLGSALGHETNRAMSLEAGDPLPALWHGTVYRDGAGYQGFQANVEWD